MYPSINWLKIFIQAFSSATWLTTANLLTFTVVVPISGYLTRCFKTKQLFVFADLVFLIAVWGASLVPNLGMLIFWRILQAVGTEVALPFIFHYVAFITPASMMVLMMGIAIFSVAAIVPVLTFFNGIGSLQNIPTKEMKVKFDYYGWLLIGISLICFVLGLENLSNSLTLGVIMITISVSSLLAFQFRTKKQTHPLFLFSLFKI